MSHYSWTAVFRRIPFLIPLAFLLWTCALWNFLSGRVALSSDAISYYEHTKFFIDQIGRGQFPLWDPYWSGGVPNDFFLRRIGPYNPFLLIPLVLNKLGISFFSAYMVFQAGYFFFGMTGFYCLARKLLKDESAAFLALLLLTFSALGTRMFDSYMLLITIPVIWFFYFLVAFFIEPRRSHAAGLTVAMMFLLTTYIPLFFLIILLSFIGLYALIFWRDLPGRIVALAAFIGRNRRFSALCAAAIIIALIPGLSFFGDAGKGGIAIPGRHYNTEAKHVLVVEPQLLSPWSMMEEFFFSFYYSDLTRVAFAIVYVPLFALLVLGAGVFSRLTRLFVLLFMWGTCLLLFSMPIGFPLYNFCYQHFGFVKYFRNLHFLLWFAGMPIFVMLVGESWSALAEQVRERGAWKVLIIAGTVHYLAFLFLLWQGDALLSTFLALAASACAWAVFLSHRPPVKQWLLPLLLIAVVIQPIEVFHHLSSNYPKGGKTLSSYDGLDYKFAHTTLNTGEGRVPSRDVGAPVSISGKPDLLYYTTDTYRNLRDKVDAGDLERYERFKFYLYDQRPPANDLAGAPLGVPVRADSERLRVTGFSCNQIRIKSRLEGAKFVVYNDVNYPGWELRVNGKKQPIEMSNGAFKGFWLPAGESDAVLRFGSSGRYAFNWMVGLLFYGMFFYTLLLYRRRDRAAA